MKKKYFRVLFLLFFITAMNAQVGIGTSTPQAILDVTSTNSGILIPRIALSSTKDISMVVAPKTAPAPYELIFNTQNVTVSPVNESVVKGFYWWDNTTTTWIRIADDVKTPSYNNDWYQKAPLSIPTGTQPYAYISGMSGNLATPTADINFVAPYTGTYQIIFIGSYGAGKVSNTGHNYNVGVSEGTFKVTVHDGTAILPAVTRVVGSRSYEGIKLGGQQSNLVNWVTIVNNVPLIAGNTCYITAEFEQFNSSNLASNSTVGIDNNGDGFADTEYRCEIQVVLISN